MPLHPFDGLLALLLTALFFGLLVEQARLRDHPAPPKAPRRGPRPLQPRTPDDCAWCRTAAARPAPTAIQALIPYTQLKSSRGRKKSINTAGFACPYPGCRYFNNTDPTVHALVGYGHHGQHDPIQDFYCQACQRKFTARRHTPLYRLKSAPACVAQVLHAVAEGLSTQAAARVFQMSETTIRCWITHAGQHSYNLHNELMRALQLTHVQLDELRLNLRGAAEASRLWVALDARTKLIPAFALGPRTQVMAHQLVHEIAQRLARDCLPISLAPPARAGVSSDGLALYFYALTAHFGEWVQTLGARRRVWIVAAQLQYAQVIKQYRHRRIIAVRHHIQLGTPETYRQVLCDLGFSGRIQTAFIERLNLTIRRSIASLARRSWSAAHSLSELALQFEWWRAVYHFTRPHRSLRQVIGEQSLRPRYRSRTPTQAAGLTCHRWTVQELLARPVPPVRAS